MDILVIAVNLWKSSSRYAFLLVEGEVGPWLSKLSNVVSVCSVVDMVVVGDGGGKCVGAWVVLVVLVVGTGREEGLF